MVKDSTAVDVPDLIGTIPSQYKDGKGATKTLRHHVESLFKEQKAKRILSYLVVNAVCTLVLICWCVSTNSIALAAYTSLTVFDFLSMLTILLTIWVKKQEQSSVYSFGYERFEVLFVFASTVLCQLASFFIIKESFERVIVEQPDIHTGRLLLGTLLVLVFHTGVLYGLHNPSFEHVIHASSSSWLQEHVSDLSESLCCIVPGLSKVLLPRLNPLSLVAVAGAASLAITHLFVHLYGFHPMDTWAGIWIALVTWATMVPMSAYTGKILLQTTPAHLIGQLDKCLREASTLDGVLEFRNEHFWTVSFGKLAGSVHVRVRRDADEQMVLAHVFHRLSNLVPLLNVHIFKDDWLRSFHHPIPSSITHHAPISSVPHYHNISQHPPTTQHPAFLKQTPHFNTLSPSTPTNHLPSLINVTTAPYKFPVPGKYANSLLPSVDMMGGQM